MAEVACGLGSDTEGWTFVGKFRIVYVLKSLSYRLRRDEVTIELPGKPQARLPDSREPKASISPKPYSHIPTTTLNTGARASCAN